MRSAAWIALARIDPDTFLTALSGVDVDSQWSVRAAIATALGSIGAERANARLVEMLKDEDQRVIPSVLNTLVTLNAPIAEATLTDRLTAEDVVVRQTAATGLARLKAVRAVPALTAAYDRAIKDPTYVARAAILAAHRRARHSRGAAAARARAGGSRLGGAGARGGAAEKVDPSVDAAARIRPAPAVGPPGTERSAAR